MAEERPGARRIAVETLLRVERDRAWADVALSGALGAATLDARDRALTTRLVYGTLAWQGLLDWHLGNLANREVASLDLPLRVILRMGMYQILLLERIPPHAAVDTSVELAKRYVRAASGMVNAVLRRALRERDTLSMPDPTDAVHYLSVTMSHPEWLVREWQRHFSPDDLRALLAANNKAAPTVLRARPACADRLLADLDGAGVSATRGRFAPDAIRIDGLGERSLPAIPPEHGTLQSEASQLVAALLGTQPGLRVLDACAAPGGKAAYLADLANDRGLVVAVERHPRRAAAVRRTARRLGLGSLVSIAADARTCAQLLHDTSFDRVLVDAPCTGLGTLRSHPEARWTRTADDPDRLAQLQAAILDGVIPLLRPGGALVYATCTLTEAENEQVVQRILATYPALERDDATAHLPTSAHGLVNASGALQTLPHRDGLDGFFAVRLRRH